MADDEPTVAERPRGAAPAREARVDGSPLERYELGDEIARGGMGRVALARDRVLGRTVAVKQLIDAEQDAEGLVRFERETAITARLEHPAIVPLYDAGRDERGLPYYVMRRVEGERLSELIGRTASVDARLALVPNVLAAADAIAHAHSRGVIHRDLKPANILVGDFGETIVIDWGLAKVLDVPEDVAHGEPASTNAGLDTVAGVVMGTPGYMAPEQLRGEPATTRSDVYALGATLHHVLAGKRAEDHPALPGVPDDLRSIVQTAMAPDPSVRFGDAGQLATELRRFLAGQLVATHHYSWRARLARFVRRHRVAVGVAAAAVAAIAVIAGVAFDRIVSARNTALDEAAAAELARQREAERADELLVERARLLAPKNPIGAITQLHRLRPESASWRRAHGVAAEAASYGLPWALAAGKTTRSIAITRDAARAYTTTTDGELWVHELHARASRRLPGVVPGAHVELLDEDRQLVLAGTAAVIVRDLASGRERSLPVTSPVIALATGGRAFGWVDESRHAFFVAGPGATPAPLGEAARLAISADGTRLAVVRLAGTDVVDATEPARVRYHHARVGWDARWSPDGRVLAIAALDGGYTITPQPDGTLREEQLVRNTTRAALFAGGSPVFAASDNFVYRPGVPSARRASGSVYPVHGALARHGAVFETANRELVVVGPLTERVIRLPGTPLAVAAAGSRAVVAIPNHVLIYELDPLLPHIIPTPATRFAHHILVGDHRLLVAGMVEVSATVRWTLYDLDGGPPEPYGETGFPAGPVASPDDGSYLVLRDSTTDRFVLLRRGGEAQQLPASVSQLIPAGSDRLILVDGRTIQRLDLATSRARILGELEPGGKLAASSTHLAIATATRLVRIELATGHRDETRLATPITALGLIGGVVVFATKGAVERWDADQRLSLATLGVAVQRFGSAADAPIAVDVDGATWAFDPARRFLPPRSDAAMWSLDGERAVSRSIDGELWLHDLVIRDRWELPFRASAMLSRAGTRLVIPYATGVGVYDVPRPTDAASYHRELARLTNLRVDDTDDVIWPD